MEYFIRMKNNKKGGVAGGVIIFIIVLLSLLIYFGYINYNEQHYINVYDDITQDVILEVPPYTERITEANKELIGECDLKVGTSYEQVASFYGGYCKRCGFEFEGKKNSFIITIREDYSITGNLNGNVLELRWVPVLHSNQIAKTEKLFGSIKKKPEENSEE